MQQQPKALGSPRVSDLGAAVCVTAPADLWAANMKLAINRHVGNYSREVGLSEVIRSCPSDRQSGS